MSFENKRVKLNMQINQNGVLNLAIENFSRKDLENELRSRGINYAEKERYFVEVQAGPLKSDCFKECVQYSNKTLKLIVSTLLVRILL